MTKKNDGEREIRSLFFILIFTNLNQEAFLFFFVIHPLISLNIVCPKAVDNDIY